MSVCIPRARALLFLRFQALLPILYISRVSYSLTIDLVVVGTYGKTFHTWRYDQQNSTYPIGIPELVMGYTGDDQITPDFVTKRDELFGLNTTEVRESRSDIPHPPLVPGADSWKYGYVLSLGIVNETTNTSFPNDGKQVVLSS